MIKYDIQIQIWDIQVDQDYFEFNYSVIQDGTERLSDRYSDDHYWKSSEEQEKFLRVLEQGFALKLVLDLLS